MIYYECACFSAARYSVLHDWPSVSSLLYEWSRFLTTLFDNTHIFAQIFSSETKIVIFICKFCLQTAKRILYKNQRTVYEYVNILFNQVLWIGHFFFEDQVYDWGHANEVKPVALLLLCLNVMSLLALFTLPVCDCVISWSYSLFLLLLTCNTNC